MRGGAKLTSSLSEKTVFKKSGLIRVNIVFSSSLFSLLQLSKGLSWTFAWEYFGTGIN